MKTDTWKPLKKRGRKKGVTSLTENQVDLEVWTIVNYLTYWKTKIENRENKKIGIKPNSPLTLPQACREFGLHPQTFYIHLKKFPALRDKYYELREVRREYLKESAEGNIENALTWGMEWLSNKDILDASFKLLEKTDKAYNPKVEIESKSISININKSSDDLYSDLSELLWFDK
jgi:hypothetical protein